MSDYTITSSDLPFAPPRAPDPVPGLVVLWSYDEPHRVGELLAMPHARGIVVGRGPARPDDPGPRAMPIRVRPGDTQPCPPLATRRISRVQLVVRPEGDRMQVENVGRTVLLHAREPVASVTVRPGDVLELRNAMLLLAVSRPTEVPPLIAPYPPFSFGEPDPYGIVGESPAAWELRGAVAFAARRGAHVLVSGPSGAGKELVARALHGLSARAGRLVSRNAATLPESLVDAELFGNRKDYPNPGMPERAGLVGDADRGTLLLDELGELPESLQAHLLRVMDQGEYQRLGESRARRADVVVVGLTNRDPGSLKHDLLARMRHRIAIPGLEERREDIPLLARALLQRARTEDSELLARFFDGDALRITPRLAEQLVRHKYATHARELDTLLWRCIEGATADFLDTGEDLPVVATTPEPERDPETLTADEVRSALETDGWVVSRAWRTLGLRNRDQLRRLMRRHGIERPDA